MRFEEAVANAIVGIDTLWGGDVMSASGTGRSIADSWFSDEPLPLAYTHPSAARMRETGGVLSKNPDHEAIARYLGEVDTPGYIRELQFQAASMGGPREQYLSGLTLCIETMWDLAMEMLGKGEPVPYARCVEASTGQPPRPSDPWMKRAALGELLAGSGYESVDAWRRAHRVPMASVRILGAAVIALYDQWTALHVVPHLPPELRSVPRANIEFLPIRDAWFSGSMNYVGRARRPGGEPRYEATYEINASLEISLPEFLQLVTHEVVPGHVTTFAYLQNLFYRRVVGFEASVLTMNTRAAALFEGIANNAILMAHGVSEIHELPDPDLRIGVLLALLQDDAKNQASYLTWSVGTPQDEVAAILRTDYLVSEERASKLSGAWGRHPLLGRMYLPVYRAGTERVADLRRRYQPSRLLPALYGCSGLVDIMTIENVLG
jgi:hypothetical protein